MLPTKEPIVSRRWDDAAGVVTPEAVRLQFQEANVGSRAVAFFIDAALLIFLMVTVNIAVGFLLAGAEGAVQLPEWIAVTTLLVANFVMFFGYPIAFETLLRGRTPGKMAMGLRVVTVEGAPERFRHAAIRAVLGLVDFALTSGAAAVLATLLSKRHQRLGDMVAGTVVLRERTATGPPRASQFTVPDGAESYAATIETAGVTTRDYEAVREFLLRAHTLHPDARIDIARRLADGLGAKLSHARPSNVSPELFLVCLAARYQQRAQLATPVPAAPPPQPEPSAAPSAPAETWGDFAPPQ